MSLPGWPHAESPFHAGEEAVQARAGSRERMEEVGRRVLRGAMPEQHREFFPLLRFVVLGAVDRGGQPWATLLAGDGPGFVTSPDATQLHVAALPPNDDPLAGLIQPGSPLALLGIELQTRRRNRANGRVAQRDEHGFTLQVLQSFGNCPKYIQRRDALPDAPQAERGPARRATQLDTPAAALVRRADTFFIATHAAGDEPNRGSDVSHRGGRPGFVQVSDDGRTLTWPDFTGNSYFNTLGNLAAEPRAGLVFPDFEHGDLLHVAGRAEIVWNGPELTGFGGAERLLRLRVDEVLYRPAASPLRWRLRDASPALQGTGVWSG
jgi:hypothetical protein